MRSINEKKTASFVSIFLISILLPVLLYAEFDSKAAKPAAVKRDSIDKVQLVSFRLIDGQTVSGRVVNDNRYEMEISEIDKYGLSLNKYKKDYIRTNTIVYNSIVAPDYWTETGDYFLEKVWDFDNDPDEFTQAIRCFEKAKSLVEGVFGPEHKLISKLNEKINKTKDDMQKWTEQARSRQQMRELEMLSAFDEKLKNISDQLSENAKSIEEMNRRFYVFEDMAKNYEQLKDKFNNSQLTTKTIERQVMKLENDIYNLQRRYGYRPRYYIDR